MKARTEGEAAAKPLGVLRLSPSRDFSFMCYLEQDCAF